MKTSWIRLIVITLVTASVGYGAVYLFNSSKPETQKDPEKYTKILGDYVNRAVLPNLANNVAAMEGLQQAVVRLRKEPSDENMQKAAEAWKKANAAYARLVVFLYGPGIHYAFDRQMNIFPLDEIMIRHHIGELEEGIVDIDTFDGASLRANYLQSEQGLPAAAWLLFCDGKVKKSSEMTSAKLAWLGAVADSLVASSLDFEAAWRGTKNMSLKQQTILKQEGKRERPSFAEEFSQPGTSGNRYASPSVSLQEMFQEMMEAVEGFLPAIVPSFESGNPRDTMSWYAQTGAEDIANQIEGLADGYLGGVEGQRGGASISDLVAEKNPILDRRIKIALAHSIYRVKKLAELDGLSDKERALEIRRAESACAKLNSNITVAMPLVCMDPEAQPFAAWGR